MAKQTADSKESRKRRATVEALDALLGRELPVLDRGFVRVIDYMGDDAAVVQAARVSYGKGTKTSSEDSGLINYLMQNSHTTPFEMCEIKLHVKLPIFVARQWIRHRTASVNEYSARYSILDNEFYLPDAIQVSKQSDSNKQGRGNPLESRTAFKVREMMANEAAQAFGIYNQMLTGLGGSQSSLDQEAVSRELARVVLPLSTYTQWYWKIDLHNLLHFLELRTDPHAQFEIRVYADRILEIVKQWVPLTYRAFVEHRLEGARLSGTAVRYLSRLLAGEVLNQEQSGLSKREWRRIQEKFQLKK
ncbi:FAD-dependent thymidylate synthase [Bradyrhizobium sp. RP6]|uniref:FAD-dependent thymidylate synthase n=1 Tax=Bradyrhizobium sp. RP6 TaxID=2489596 RepID=UPI001FE0FEE0|nr:FAD-dependent thymidylate synthase [Bradyrhizobium sp. RP6]